jgi:hypothetical protein
MRVTSEVTRICGWHIDMLRINPCAAQGMQTTEIVTTDACATLSVVRITHCIQEAKHDRLVA